MLSIVCRRKGIEIVLGAVLLRRVHQRSASS